MGWTNFHISTAILDFLFPQFCKKCEQQLARNEIRYCRKCLANLEPTDLGNWITKVTTGNDLDFAFSAYWFDNLLQDCIHTCKYHGFQKLLRKISELAINNIGRYQEIENVNAIVPVPLHRVRQRERGFNQAKVIADALGKHLKIPVNQKILRRVKWTATQTKLDIESRKQNTKHAFRVKGNCSGMKILLIDDVLTSGATANSCSRVLKECGAASAGVFTLSTPKLRIDRSI